MYIYVLQTFLWLFIPETRHNTYGWSSLLKCQDNQLHKLEYFQCSWTGVQSPKILSADNKKTKLAWGALGGQSSWLGIKVTFACLLFPSLSEPCCYGDGEVNTELVDHCKNIVVGYKGYFKLTYYFCNHFTCTGKLQR